MTTSGDQFINFDTETGIASGTLSYSADRLQALAVLILQLDDEGKVRVALGDYAEGADALGTAIKTRGRGGENEYNKWGLELGTLKGSKRNAKIDPARSTIGVAFYKRPGRKFGSWIEDGVKVTKPK